jgi:hypothetical protein
MLEAILARQKLIDIPYDRSPDDPSRNEVGEMVEYVLDIMNSTVVRDLNSFGLSVLEVDNYDQVYGLLKGIKNGKFPKEWTPPQPPDSLFQV